tara:strand:- start:124 stop:312 length:189 start_codon:yes stop_codon:yes gene_type:complete
MNSRHRSRIANGEALPFAIISIHFTQWRYRTERIIGKSWSSLPGTPIIKTHRRICEASTTQT